MAGKILGDSSRPDACKWCGDTPSVLVYNTSTYTLMEYNHFSLSITDTPLSIQCYDLSQTSIDFTSKYLVESVD